MKITDKLGRSLAVDVVVKAPLIDMWMEPLGYNLDNSATQFLRVSNGPFALRVMSKLGVDLLVHLNGKRLLAVKVPKGIQYLECDQEGQLFFFGTQKLHENMLHEATPLVEGDTASDTDQQAAMQTALAVPSGDGVLFVVARFADDPIHGLYQPPRQEFSATFQLRAPEDHDRSLAGSLSRVLQPELPDEPDAVIKMTPSNRPTFVCTCTGCTTGKGHSHKQEISRSAQ